MPGSQNPSPLSCRRAPALSPGCGPAGPAALHRCIGCPGSTAQSRASRRSPRCTHAPPWSAHTACSAGPAPTRHTCKPPPSSRMGHAGTRPPPTDTCAHKAAAVWPRPTLAPPALPPCRQHGHCSLSLQLQIEQLEERAPPALGSSSPANGPAATAHPTPPSTAPRPCPVSARAQCQELLPALSWEQLALPWVEGALYRAAGPQGKAWLGPGKAKPAQHPCLGEAASLPTLAGLCTEGTAPQASSANRRWHSLAGECLELQQWRRRGKDDTTGWETTHPPSPLQQALATTELGHVQLALELTFCVACGCHREQEPAVTWAEHLLLQLPAGADHAQPLHSMPHPTLPSWPPHPNFCMAAAARGWAQGWDVCKPGSAGVWLLAAAGGWPVPRMGCMGLGQAARAAAQGRAGLA